MNPQGRQQRKQILVVKKIQYRFAAFVILLSAGAAFLTSLAVFYAVLTVLGDKLASVYPQGRLAPIVRSAYAAFIIVFTMFVPLICYLAIRFSHKVVGPLPKIYQYLSAVGQGEYPGKLVLRDKDHLSDLAIMINEMAEGLKSRNAIQSPPSSQAPSKQ